jgi:hypothetical protein
VRPESAAEGAADGFACRQGRSGESGAARRLLARRALNEFARVEVAEILAVFSWSLKICVPWRVSFQTILAPLPQGPQPGRRDL